MSVGRLVDRVELREELGVAEAGVALPTVGVEDPQRRSPPRWAGAIARDDHLRSLADDVSPQPDPGASGELEADPGGLADRALEAAGAAARRLKDHERDPGSTGERGNPGESIAESRFLAARQVDDQQVHRPTREERAGDGQALLGIGGRQDDEPLRLDAAGHRLDWIERRGEVQPGHDGAGGLGLRREPQGQRRSPARDVTADRQAHPARHAAGAEDRVKLGEAGRMDSIRIGDRCGGRPEIRGLQRHGGERAHDLTGEAARTALTGEPGRRGTPSRPEGRQRRSQVGGGSNHARSIEQMFE